MLEDIMFINYMECIRRGDILCEQEIQIKAMVFIRGQCCIIVTCTAVTNQGWLLLKAHCLTLKPA